ncbi:MAG: DEAD/DEAH box helicase, partial [Bacteroidota bacterium]
MKEQINTTTEATVYFDELGLNDQILDGLYDMNFETATPIQSKAIPTILKGKDIIACAQTGTGKTAAFLLPLLQKVMDLQQNATSALILVPTRELAMQID